MESNLYALEKQVESRIEEARAAVQRAALCSLVRDESPGLWKRAVLLLALRPNRRLAPGPSRI